LKIIRASSAGFCFGVRRAFSLAFEAADRYSPVYSLGPLIHSPQVVKRLQERGVEVVEDVDGLSEGVVIVRSHGVTAEKMEEILASAMDVVDATCPFVKKAQEYAAMLRNEGYSVVLVGEKDHPEVQGIISYAENGNVYVVADFKEASSLPRKRKMGIVAQTTQSYENLRQIVDVCLEKSLELRVFNTICDATSIRQEEARSIARRSDMVLIVGGFNSANTTRLAQICREIQPHSQHVETADQIDPEWFEGVEVLGITAGASTPAWIIDEILEKVEKLKK